MACRSAGRLIGALALGAALLAFSCGAPPADKPLDPRLTFSIGSSFLEGVSTVALKGQIEFDDGVSRQSGDFQAFLVSSDSLSFLIEGPLGADVFKMVIVDGRAFLRSNGDDGWTVIGRGERADIADYGIENISPFLTGFFIFPQYYVRSADREEAPGELIYIYDSQEIISRSSDTDREFLLREPGAGISAVYSRRKEIGDGYYPSRVTIFKPGADWRIGLTITGIRLNPRIPGSAWSRG